MSFPINFNFRTSLSHPVTPQQQNTDPPPRAPIQALRLTQHLPPAPQWPNLDPVLPEVDLSASSPLAAFDAGRLVSPQPTASPMERAQANPPPVQPAGATSSPRVLVRVLHAREMPESKRRRIEPPVAAPPEPFLPDDLSRADLFEAWLQKLADTNKGGLGLQFLVPFLPSEIMHMISDGDSPNFIPRMAQVSKGMYASIDLAFPLRRTAGLMRDLKLALDGRRDVTGKLFDRMLKAVVTPRNGYDQALLTPLDRRMRNLMLLMMLEWVDTLRSYMRPPRIAAIGAHLARLAPPELALVMQDYAIFKDSKHGRYSGKEYLAESTPWFCEAGLEKVVRDMPSSEAKTDVLRALLLLFQKLNEHSDYDQVWKLATEDLHAELYLYAGSSKKLARIPPALRTLAMHRVCNILIDELPKANPKCFTRVHLRRRWPDLKPSDARKAMAAMLLSLNGVTDEDRNSLLPKLAGLFDMLMGLGPGLQELQRNFSSFQVSAGSVEPQWILGSHKMKPSSGSWIFKQLVSGMASMPEGESKEKMKSLLNTIPSRALNEGVRIHLLELLESGQKTLGHVRAGQSGHPM